MLWESDCGEGTPCNLAWHRRPWATPATLRYAGSERTSPSPLTVAAYPSGLGAAAHHHRPDHQRDRDTDTDPRRQGHQPDPDERVPLLLQPLRPGTVFCRLPAEFALAVYLHGA